jgi:AcrR family transcriptional regulator
VTSGTPRGYDSPARREKARATERRVLAAAAELLLTEGWAGTSMAAIATRAGVSPTLLYKSFGTKVALAKRLYDVTLVGDDEPVPLSARPEIAAIAAEPDPRRKIAGYVRLALTVVRRVGPLTARLRAAAVAGDADMAEFVATTDGERRAGGRGFVGDLAAAGALRPGLSPERAVDAVWTLLAPDLVTRLVDECGWPDADVERWLVEQIGTALLGTTTGDGRPG